MAQTLRVAFAGTPVFAASALEAVAAAGFTPVLVLTQPDRPSGRGLKLQPSPVKALAQRLAVTVIQPRSLRLDGRFADDARAAEAALREAAPDLLLVAAYGLLLPAWVLALPRLGCLNIHASLLPRWRGAAPIHRAIEAGDPVTGITLMQMDEGLDTGDMLMAAEEPIAAHDSTGTLHDRLAALGARLTVQALERLARGEALPRVPQPTEGVTYARKIDKAEAALDWRRPAAELERRVRALDPAPGAHLEGPSGPVKVWRAAVMERGGTSSGPVPTPGTVTRPAPDRLAVACPEGGLELLEVQLPGGRRISAKQWLTSPQGAGCHEGLVLPVPPEETTQVAASAGR